ncbi:MAG: hypothetical protein Sylvanvirus40_4, partial [Sylvanvirus sp.]
MNSRLRSTLGRTPNSRPPTLEVIHRVYPGVEYPAFIAACTAMLYDIFGLSQHTAISTWLEQDH